MDTQVRAAIAASRPGGLPPGILGELLAGALRLEVATGAAIHREGEQVPHVSRPASTLTGTARSSASSCRTAATGSPMTSPNAAK